MRSHASMLVAGLALLASGPVAAEAPPAAPAAIDPATLDWPAQTASVEIKRAMHLSLWPGKKAPLAVKVEAGTRLGFTQVVEGTDRGKRACKAWVELQPMGWACTTAVTPSLDPPGGTPLPVVAAGALTPDVYYRISQEGTPAYATVDDISAGVIADELGDQVKFKLGKKVTVDGVAYVKTHRGYVEAAAISKMSPSAWVGLDLRTAAPPAWPFAFVVPPRGERAAAVRATPDRKAKISDAAAKRALVTVGVEQDGLVETDLGWIARTDLRVIRRQARPPGVAAGEPWIDVDLDEQTLVAYAGDTPVYATLISTGKRKKTTPPASYRLRSKAASVRMAAEEWEARQYDIGEVPWAQRFAKGLYLHAAFWHDNFGNRQSAGCVNLSPKDARALYEWTTPGMPPGVAEREIPLAQGMLIRIRDADHPDPPAYDYRKERKAKYTADDWR
ncbi:MAG: L,D-transpeptidase [Kofleriaceae bacterium]